MFEKGNKDSETIETKDPFQADTRSTLETPAPEARRGRRDVAVIGSSIQINGDLRGNEDLLIEGDVSGTVRLDNNVLTIGKSGKVKAGVYAKSIAVDGETKGDLHATDCVSVHANARVQGNIIAPRVSIVEGAHFKGSIEMDPKAVDEALGRSTPPKSKASATPNKSKDSSAADNKATDGTADNQQAKSA